MLYKLRFYLSKLIQDLDLLIYDTIFTEVWYKHIFQIKVKHHEDRSKNRSADYEKYSHPCYFRTKKNLIKQINYAKYY